MDPFVAEIRIFPFNFAPKNWAFCDGQLLSLSQNTALFSLVGTYYGGNGLSNFALPNLQGNAPMHTTQYAGGGPFGTFDIGQTGGSETVTLLETEMPAHTHSLMAVINPGTARLPAPNLTLARSSGANAYHTTATNLSPMADAAVVPVGGDQPHNNLMPYLTLNFCIALQGVYPPRT